jgi:hypothetical protein
MHEFPKPQYVKPKLPANLETVGQEQALRNQPANLEIADIILTPNQVEKLMVRLGQYERYFRNYLKENPSETLIKAENASSYPYGAMAIDMGEHIVRFIYAPDEGLNSDLKPIEKVTVLEKVEIEDLDYEQYLNADELDQLIGERNQGMIDYGETLIFTIDPSKQIKINDVTTLNKLFSDLPLDHEIDIYGDQEFIAFPID